MSIRYNFNGNQFVHQINRDQVEIRKSNIRISRIRSAFVNFFKYLWRKLCPCLKLSKRVIEEMPPEKPEWSNRVKMDSITTRNDRINNCHIPEIKGITQYFNSVRDNHGMYHGTINVALRRLNPYITPIVSNNYLLVKRNYSQLAFEEAIAIQEALMFEGVDAIPAFKLFLHPYDDEGNAYPTPSDDSVYMPDYCGVGEDYHKDYFSSSEESLFHDDTDKSDQSLFRENSLMEPESKMSTFGLLLPAEGRNECSICNERFTSTETSCCQVHICFNCFSCDIVTKTKRDLNHWLSRNQMVACVNCRSPFQLGAHEQELSDTAQNILDYFNQQYIISLHSQYSNVLAVYCKDVNCKKTYLILEDSTYFQCNNIADHSDHRIKLHHVDCGFLWQFDHNCPASPQSKTKNAIATVKYLIRYVNSIRRCPGTTNNECTYLIEKNDGCLHMTCPECNASYCWYCEKDWKTHGTSYDQCVNPREAYKTRKKHLSKLNKELEVLILAQRQ